MTSLTDRYVAATVRSLPETQRVDVERELRASIEDDIDARCEAGAEPVEAERDVLTGLGDPAGLAARYSERPLYLIGPTNFLFYRRSLIALLAIIVPIAAIGSALVHALVGEGIGSVMAAAASTALSAAMQIAFWVTLVFAILDWTGASKNGPLVRWNLDMLPDVPQKRALRNDAIASIVWLAILLAFLVYAQFFPIAWNAAGPVREPLFDPALWGFWLPYVIVLILAEAVLVLVVYRAGGWTWPLAGVNAVLAAAAAVPIAVLAVAGELVNPDFLAAFEWAGSDAVLTVLGVSIAVVSVGAASWDAIDGFVRAAASRRARDVS
jgi:magnesium-transporting ATPase (P-type)